MRETLHWDQQPLAGTWLFLIEKPQEALCLQESEHFLEQVWGTHNVLPDIMWKGDDLYAVGVSEWKRERQSQKNKIYFGPVSLEAIYFQIKSLSCLPNQDFHTLSPMGAVNKIKVLRADPEQNWCWIGFKRNVAMNKMEVECQSVSPNIIQNYKNGWYVSTYSQIHTADFWCWKGFVIHLINSVYYQNSSDPVSFYEFFLSSSIFKY